MLTRFPRGQMVLVALSTASALQVTAFANDDCTKLSSAAPLSYSRRERAAKVLTIANAVEPNETATALRLARSSMRQESLQKIEPRERMFLRQTLKEGVARGIACAAGGAATAYAIIKVVLFVIPLVPSPHVTRAAMSAVSFGAAALELAAVPDITTIELLLMKNSALGSCARRTIEDYDPHLLLLQTLDRQSQMPEGRESRNPFDSQEKKYGYLDTEIHS